MSESSCSVICNQVIIVLLDKYTINSVDTITFYYLSNCLSYFLYTYLIGLKKSALLANRSILNEFDLFGVLRSNGWYSKKFSIQENPLTIYELNIHPKEHISMINTSIFPPLPGEYRYKLTSVMFICI